MDCMCTKKRWRKYKKPIKSFGKTPILFREMLNHWTKLCRKISWQGFSSRAHLETGGENPATSTSPGRFRPRCFDPGNSHSRGPCPLLAIPDLRLPASATGGGRLRSHRRRADGNLVKYGVRTHLEMIREENSLALHKRKHPTFVGCFLLWNPATSYSPGPSPSKYHRR